MKEHLRRVCVLLGLAGIAVGLVGCGLSEEEARRDVLANEAALSGSFNTGDPATIDRLLADDFVGVDLDGSHYRKAELKLLTAQFAKSGGKYSTTDVSVRIYRDTAVTQDYDHTTHADGTAGHGTAWTDTWVQRNRTWKLVAAEDLPMPR